MLVGEATVVRFGNFSSPGKLGYVLSVGDQKATEKPHPSQVEFHRGSSERVLVSDNLVLCSWFGFLASRREQGCPQRLRSDSHVPGLIREHRPVPVAEGESRAGQPALRH